jgi:hypothetical protein
MDGKGEGWVNQQLVVLLLIFCACLPEWIARPYQVKRFVMGAHQ